MGGRASGFKLRRTAITLFPMVLCVLVLASRVARNGTYFGLDFNLFQPDGRFYLWEAYRFIGKSDSQAWGQVTSFYQHLHLVSTHYTSSISPLNDLGLRRDINSRPLYPLLSVPFVVILGGAGMLVIPILCLTASCYLVVFSFRDDQRKFIAFAGFAVLSTSPFFLRGFFSNYTDPLLALLVLIAFILLRQGYQNVWVLFFLSLLGEATRPSEPLWIVIFLLFFIATKKRRFLFLTLFHVIFLGCIAILTPDSVGSSTRGGYSPLVRVFDFVPHVLKILIIDISEIAILDKILFSFLAIYLISIVRVRRKRLDYVALLLLMTTFAMSAWNGAVGTGWRYELPSFCPILITLIDRIPEKWVNLMDTRILRWSRGKP